MISFSNWLEEKAEGPIRFDTIEREAKIYVCNEVLDGNCFQCNPQHGCDPSTAKCSLVLSLSKMVAEAATKNSVTMTTLRISKIKERLSK